MKFTGINSFLMFVNALVGGGFTPSNFCVNDIIKDFKEKRLTISYLQCNCTSDSDKLFTISFYNVYGENVLNYTFRG